MTAVEQFVKPGHWAVATQQMQARERDFIGRTRTEVTDEKQSPILVNSTPFLLQSSRPAALPKGTTKFVDSTFFVPQTDIKFRLLTTFEEGGLGVSVPRITQPQRMLSHQYHFLVLAKEPERYSLLKTLDSVQVPYSGEPGSIGRHDHDRPTDDSLSRRHARHQPRRARARQRPPLDVDRLRPVG